MSDMSMKEWALFYAENGIAVFPLQPGTKIPFPGTAGVKDATNDLCKINVWWDRWPNANIGLAMGAISNLIGLDIDFKDGCRADFMSSIPPTMTTITPTGGRHAFFKYCDVKNGKKLEKGVTVRSDGYYFVAGPSIHPNGGKYVTETCPAEETPQWIIDCEPFKEIGVAKQSTGSRHDLLRDRIWRLRNDFPNWKAEDFWRDINAFKAQWIENPDEKTDDEIRRMIDGALAKPVTPERRIVSPQEALNEDMAQSVLIYSAGNRIDFLPIVNRDEKTVELLTSEACIKRHLTKASPNINPKALASAFQHLKHYSPSLREAPLPFTFKSQDEWCFKKLGFDPEEGDHPAWDSFLKRLSGPEEFRAFVWSAFEYKCHSRQFCYLYGKDGQEGKSTVCNVLAECFGPAGYALTSSSIRAEGGGRWLTASLVGKRFVVWADCLKPWFCGDEALRNVTSGDLVECERKGEQPFSTRIYVRLLIASNKPPIIGEEGADASRLIRIDVEPLAKNDHYKGFKAGLISELPYFLWSCRQAYEKLCPDHDEIRVGSKTAELVEGSSHNEVSRWAHIIEDIEFGPGLTELAGPMNRYCKDLGLNDVQVGFFKTYLNQKHGVMTRRIGDDRKLTYFGCKIRPDREKLVEAPRWNAD